MCTSIIISGKLTKDGRPLMLKHRDQRNANNNRIEFFRGEKYNFIGLVNSEYDKGQKAWCGTNDVGFSIISTASFNLLDRHIKGLSSPEIMYKALSVCCNTKDFEQLLSHQDIPMISTNYGVIDSEGGAAYYEVCGNQWIKYDVNDSQSNPEGFLIRTNFSFSGNPNRLLGYDRYMNAKTAVENEKNSKCITPQWIFNNISRSFKNEQSQLDLTNCKKNIHGFADQDFIPTTISVAAIVFQGVNKMENPLNTIMWTILGYPPTGMVVPLFCHYDLPDFVVKRNCNNNSKICDLALMVKSKIFHFSTIRNRAKFNFELLYSKEGTGLTQKLMNVENELLNDFDKKMQQWRKTSIDFAQLFEFYSNLIHKAESLYDFFIESLNKYTGISYLVDTTDVSLTKKELIKLKLQRIKKTLNIQFFL